MKTIGLIGGVTWHSTLLYYRIINESVNRRLGGLHSSRCIIYSIDFDDMAGKNEGRWDVISKDFIDIAGKLEAGGVDFLIICANTIHKIYDKIQNSVGIPVLHIVDCTGEKIVEKGFSRVGLLGTKYTMGENFYKDRLKEKFGVDVVVPEGDDFNFVHDVIIKDLTIGLIKKSSKQRYIDIIDGLVDKGAEGVILGCTEIPLLINEGDVDVPVFDTTGIHAEAAVDFALK